MMDTITLTFARVRSHRERRKPASSLIWLVMILTMVGCKKPSVTADEDTAQVKSLHDYTYYLGFDRSKNKADHYLMDDTHKITKVHDHSYQFVVCLLHRENPYGTHKPRYIENSGWNRDEIRVLGESCLPAYLGTDGKPLKLVVDKLHPANIEHQVEYLETEKLRRSTQNGMLEVAAFGSGASMAAFSPSFRGAITKMVSGLPKHQLIAATIQIGQFFLPHQAYPNDRFLELIVNQHKVTRLLPAEEDKPPNPYLTSSASFGAGAAAGTALSNAGVFFFGPPGAIGGQMLIPFLTTFILHAEENPAKDILENFYSLYNPRKSDSEVGSEVKSVPLAVRKLGQSLVVAGWAELEEMNQFCLPHKTASGLYESSCELLFDSYAVNHIGAPTK